MDRYRADAAALAQERRLAQLTDDNAFLDIQALLRQQQRGGGSDVPSGAVGGGTAGDSSGSSALSRLKGQSRVHLPASYANQHKTYVDMWNDAWRTAEEESSDDSEGDGEGTERRQVKATRGRRRRTSSAMDASMAEESARGPRKRGRGASPIPHSEEGVTNDQGSSLAANAVGFAEEAWDSSTQKKLQRGERKRVDLRDAQAIARELAEEMRVLKAWQVIQSARCSAVAARHRRATSARKPPVASQASSIKGRENEGSVNELTLAESLEAPVLLGLSDTDALKVLEKQDDGVHVPRSMHAEVLLALTRCPSHLAMRAPPPSPLPASISVESPTAGTPLSMASAPSSLSSSAWRREKVLTEIRGSDPMDGDAAALQKRTAATAAAAPWAVAPLAETAPGTVGGVQGDHLCSVCLRRAGYRCLRCRTALFCSIDCHVIHDATRCLKYIV